MEDVMYGYIAFYKSQRWEIYTDKGILEAQYLAADHFKVSRKKSYLIHVVLGANQTGETVIHIPDF